jgi:hypothetical protein
MPTTAIRTKSIVFLLTASFNETQSQPTVPPLGTKINADLPGPAIFEETTIRVKMEQPVLPQ